MSSKDDVLDFINSLPDSKAGTPVPEGKEDIMEFLDELEAHEKRPQKLEPKAKSTNPKLVEKTGDEDPAKQQEKEKDQEQEIKSAQPESEIKSANSELEIDPINSITNWWNKEGSNAVSNIWGSITNNATNISETTYQLASNTTNQLNLRRQEFLKDQEINGEKTFEQISSITQRLNGILSDISETIMGNEDELLNIITVQDFELSYLPDLISKNFGKVMNQVEGGIKIQVNDFNHKRDPDNELNLFVGKLIDGEKLCVANLENSINNFNKVMEFEKNENTEINEKLKSINRSNIFISILPINMESFKTDNDSSEIVIDQNNSSSFQFILVLRDITNNIVIKTKTQAFPLIWSNWLIGKQNDAFVDYDIDPKEWVKGWIRDGLNLSIGIISQQYVIKRMGF